MSGYAAACWCDNAPPVECDCDPSLGTADFIDLKFMLAKRFTRYSAYERCPDDVDTPIGNHPPSGNSQVLSQQTIIQYNEVSLSMKCEFSSGPATRRFRYPYDEEDGTPAKAQVLTSYIYDQALAETSEQRLSSSSPECNDRVTYSRIIRETRNAYAETNLSGEDTIDGPETDDIGQSAIVGATSYVALGKDISSFTWDPLELEDDIYYRVLSASVQPTPLGVLSNTTRTSIGGQVWETGPGDSQNLLTSLDRLSITNLYRIGEECDFFARGELVASKRGEFFNQPEGNYFPPYTSQTIQSFPGDFSMEIRDQPAFPEDCIGVPECNLDGYDRISNNHAEGAVTGWNART